MGYNCELKTKENSNERNTQLLTQECFERTVCRLGEYAKDIPGNVFLGETHSWGVSDALYHAYQWCKREDIKEIFIVQVLPRLQFFNFFLFSLPPFS